MGFILHESKAGGERGARIMGDKPDDSYGEAPMTVAEIQAAPPRLPADFRGPRGGELASSERNYYNPSAPKPNDCAPPRPAPKAVAKRPFIIGGGR